MLTLAASEGLAGGIQADVAEMIAADSDFLDILVQTATDLCILGMASHLIYIGQRVAAPYA